MKEHVTVYLGGDLCLLCYVYYSLRRSDAFLLMMGLNAGDALAYL
jgi:hypothetical protein